LTQGSPKAARSEAQTPLAVRIERLGERAGVEHVLGPGLEVANRRLAYTFDGFGRQDAETAPK